MSSNDLIFRQLQQLTKTSATTAATVKAIQKQLDEQQMPRRVSSLENSRSKARGGAIVGGGILGFLGIERIIHWLSQ